jgi:putative DNA primase/helicase
MDYTAVRRKLPQEMLSLRQFVAWRWGKVRQNGKREKVPVNPHNGKADDVKNPKMWGSFERACSYARDHFMDGIGFVFSEDDPFCGVDLYDCVDPDTGMVGLGIDEILDSLDTYAEISPSGEGVKAILKATHPGYKHQTEDTPWGGKLEIYDRNRFFTITGEVYRDAPVRDAQRALTALYGDLFGSGGVQGPESLSNITEGRERATEGLSGRG